MWICTAVGDNVFMVTGATFSAQINQSISCRRQSLCVNRGNLPWSGDLLLDNVSGVEAALLAQAGCHQAATDDQQEQHHSSQQFSPQHNSSSRNIDSLTTQLQPVTGLDSVLGRIFIK